MYTHMQYSEKQTTVTTAMASRDEAVLRKTILVLGIDLPGPILAYITFSYDDFSLDAPSYIYDRIWREESRQSL